MPHLPEYQNQDEFQNRTKKLAEIRHLGVDPYPHAFSPSDKAKDLLVKWEGQPVGNSEEAQEERTSTAKLAGRLVLFRSMGKNAFAQIQDETGHFQIMCTRDHVKVRGYSPSGDSSEILSPMKFIEKKLDLGDIIGVEGFLFRTQKGELTLFVKELTLLCKTLLPLADKHSGLADKELRYRKRWLDLISHLDVQESFRKRSYILQLTREYFYEHGFLEVETPVLQSIYGGAEARPFITKLHALDQEMFMRISLEIPLKKLIVGGMNRVFELGKVFRNEGIDRNHNPEFTLLEAYAAYWDYNTLMTFVENLFEHLALKIYGSTKIKFGVPHEASGLIEIDLKAPWTRMTMKDSIAQYGGIQVDKLSDEEMRTLLIDSGHMDPKKVSALSRGLLIAALFEIKAEPHLVQPHHIIDHPIETTPLCKPHRDPQERSKGLVERFESFICGQEICNAYSELNDPELQRTLLVQQADRREAGDEEASPLDEEFLEAICQGMPPTGGVGIGIDRLVMLLSNAHSIRDVLYFPWMKPLDFTVD